MRNRASFYQSQFVSLETKYLDCQDISEPEERSLKIANILTQLKAIDKNSCPENDKALFAFKVEALQLDILYKAIFLSETPLPKEHEVSLKELLARYKQLTNSAGYQALKPWDAEKQKIDRYLSNLESELIQNQQLNVSR